MRIPTPVLRANRPVRGEVDLGRDVIAIPATPHFYRFPAVSIERIAGRAANGAASDAPDFDADQRRKLEKATLG